MNNLDALRGRAEALHLNGLLAHWTHVAKESWVQTLIDWEEQERARRSLERRLRAARIGRFKPICDFDWNWPKRCDRTAFEALMSLDFLKDATNVVLVGPRPTQSPRRAGSYRSRRSTVLIAQPNRKQKRAAPTVDPDAANYARIQTVANTRRVAPAASPIGSI